MLHRHGRRPATPRRARRRLLLGGGLLGLALLLTGCNEGFGQTKGATTQSHLEFRLWFGMMVAGIAVAVFVWALIFWAVFRYRRRDDRMPKQFREHIPLELTYTIIPLILVIIIFAFTVVVENNIDSVIKPPQVIVNVTAYQWGWVFQYSKPGPDPSINCTDHPQQCVTVQTAPGAAPSALARSYTDPLYPQLVLPIHASVRIYLRSHDVIHGFYVRALNFSRYAQPPITNEFEFQPTVIGVFPGQCTQYCGLYHSEMLFSVRIVTPAQFQTWFAQQERKLKAQATFRAT